ncbi:MAG TPA: SIMPL domain-containing protein [Polyangiales bacterium]|nr:SIMPL domain-containing protein [Polyangiales bacterium]
MFQHLLQWTAAVCAFAATGCMHPHHHAKSAVEGQGLSVVGIGEVKSKPDVARATLGIEVRGESAEAATAQANQQMTAVVNALKAAGVADKDLRTNEFSVAYERDYTPPPPVVIQLPAAGKKGEPTVAPAAPAEPKGSYRVSNTVEVTVRDVAKTSAVLSAATNAGANNVWGVSFDIDNKDPLHAKAREEAIAKAKANAQQLASLSGVALGRIVTIDDQADDGQVAPRMYAMKAASDSANTVPVESGELTVRHQVRLVYDLGEAH